MRTRTNTEFVERAPGTHGVGGHVGRPRGRVRTFAATTFPAVGDSVLCITRYLDGAMPALSDLEVRAFRADAQHHAVAPDMDVERLMDHPAGLGVISCSITGQVARAHHCLIAGSSDELKRFHARSGVLAWLITHLEMELAAAGISFIVIPRAAVADDAERFDETRASWFGEIMMTLGYAWDESQNAFVATMNAQLLPRR